MARTSGSSPLWKETPSTNMKKAQLLDIANAKEARIIHLRRKNKERKAALRDVRAALAAAQATQVAAQPAITTLIPKPRGTSGRGGFNLANEMGVDGKTSRQIQGFVRSLVNMSALDKTVSWKSQPGDEIHKIFTVTADKYPIMKNFEYNWATAEMVKLYLKNSRAQEARKARTTTEVSVGTQEVAATNGLATANDGAGASRSGADSDSD